MRIEITMTQRGDTAHWQITCDGRTLANGSGPCPPLDQRMAWLVSLTRAALQHTHVAHWHAGDWAYTGNSMRIDVPVVML